jgi:transcriptional regulator with XRE-family HTH domain
MQLPDRLRLELAHYLIGPKLKVLRLRRSMGLLQLGERTGLSPSLLSRVENGKHLPTVPTLLRIALVFNVTLDHFFRNEKRPRVIAITRREERQQAVSGDPAGHDGCLLSNLDLGSGERKFHPYLAEFSSSGKRTRFHAHEGVEFIHVLCGTLGLLIGTEENVLGPGDSIYFDSSLRHAYRGLAGETCTAMMVCAHPGRSVAERRMDRLEDLHVVGRHSRLSNRTPLSGGAVAGRAKEFTTGGNGPTRKMEPIGLPPGAKSRAAVAPAPLSPGATDAGGDRRKPRSLIVANDTPAAACNGNPTRRVDRATRLLRASAGPAKRKAK